MKTIKIKLEAVKVKSFVTTIEHEKMSTIAGGSSHDTLHQTCELQDPIPFNYGETSQVFP